MDQDVPITDMDAFIAYNEAVLAQEEVKVNVKGQTGLHEMSFPTAHVDYDATATLKGRSDILPYTQNNTLTLAVGLNKLSGFNVTSFSILLEAEPDGSNMIGEVLLPNPTSMTLTMVRTVTKRGLNSIPLTSLGESDLQQPTPSHL